MNATNRGVNRVVLFLVGILLIGVGAAAVMVAVWQTAGDLWTSWSSSAVEWAVSVNRASRLSESTPVSWLTLAILALLALVVVIAVIIMTRLGGGRSSVVFREESGAGAEGPVVILHGFAADAITQSLASCEEILFAKVNARRLWHTDMLHVSVTPRQNVSPVAVARTVSGLIDRLATLLGREISAIVTVHSGVRSRLASNQPRVN